MNLGLGTVQFGLPYGVSNAHGQVPQTEAAAILSLAAEHRIAYLDTAADYGDSETVLGGCISSRNAFRIITKTSRMQRGGEGAAAVESVRAHFVRSLERLRQPFVDGLLVHHAGDLMGENGKRLWRCLQELRSEGLVSRIGVSVYGGEELRKVTDVFEIDLVQAPLNIFDQRLLASGELQRLKAAGVEVHGRSVFLQGLLLMEPDALPASLAFLRPKVEAYRRFLEQHGLTPIEGALRFASQVSQVDCWIVGVCRAAQLADLFRAMPADGAPHLDFTTFAMEDEAVINPSSWKL